MHFWVILKVLGGDFMCNCCKFCSIISHRSAEECIRFPRTIPTIQRFPFAIIDMISLFFSTKCHFSIIVFNIYWVRIYLNSNTAAKPIQRIGKQTPGTNPEVKNFKIPTSYANKMRRYTPKHQIVSKNK